METMMMSVATNVVAVLYAKVGDVRPLMIWLVVGLTLFAALIHLMPRGRHAAVRPHHRHMPHKEILIDPAWGVIKGYCDDDDE